MQEDKLINFILNKNNKLNLFSQKPNKQNKLQHLKRKGTSFERQRESHELVVRI